MKNNSSKKQSAGLMIIFALTGMLLILGISGILKYLGIMSAGAGLILTVLGVLPIIVTTIRFIVICSKERK